MKTGDVRLWLSEDMVFVSRQNGKSPGGAPGSLHNQRRFSEFDTARARMGRKRDKA